MNNAVGSSNATAAAGIDDDDNDVNVDDVGQRKQGAETTWGREDKRRRKKGGGGRGGGGGGGNKSKKGGGRGKKQERRRKEKEWQKMLGAYPIVSPGETILHESGRRKEDCLISLSLSCVGGGSVWGTGSLHALISTPGFRGILPSGIHLNVLSKQLSLRIGAYLTSEK